MFECEIRSFGIFLLFENVMLFPFFTSKLLVFLLTCVSVPRFTSCLCLVSCSCVSPVLSHPTLPRVFSLSLPGPSHMFSSVQSCFVFPAFFLPLEFLVLDNQSFFMSANLLTNAVSDSG